MILFKKADTLSKYVHQQKSEAKNIGFVPTMGALHEGHLSLIKSSKANNQVTVCSIFVNPTQFNNPEDFKLYPITIEKDIEKLMTSGCDVLFLPSKDEIYPLGYMTKHYNLGKLETVLEGHYRPGHFQGVCQVVDRLLEIVKPNNLYLGSKDYQQCKVIARLTEILGNKDSINLSFEPTVREEDGLAMSSRNLRLSKEQRKLAPSLFESLLYIKQNQNNRELQLLQIEAANFLTSQGFLVDYLQVVDADTLQKIDGETNQTIALVAASLGDIRLIDNLLLN